MDKFDLAILPINWTHSISSRSKVKSKYSRSIITEKCSNEFIATDVVYNESTIRVFDMHPNTLLGWRKIFHQGNIVVNVRFTNDFMIVWY